MKIVLRPRQTENKRPVDPLYRCLAPRDDRLKMLEDAAVARQQLESRWTGTQPERPSRRRGANLSDHHPPPASDKPARVQRGEVEEGCCPSLGQAGSLLQAVSLPASFFPARGTLQCTSVHMGWVLQGTSRKFCVFTGWSTAHHHTHFSGFLWTPSFLPGTWGF